MKTFLSLTCASLLLTACAGDPAPQIQAMQKKDKQLSCKEILLEMNEAQFYMKSAQKNKGPQLKSVLMPLGYISTYMNAQEAIDAASARIDYLDKVYNIMDCEKQEAAGWNAAPVNSYYQQKPPAQYMGTNYPAAQQPQASANDRYTPNYRYEELRDTGASNDRYW